MDNKFDLESLVNRATRNRETYRRGMTHPASKNFKGVRLQGSRWEAYTNSSRGWIFIGDFETELQAHEARETYCREHGIEK